MNLFLLSYKRRKINFKTNLMLLSIVAYRAEQLQATLEFHFEKHGFEGAQNTAQGAR